MSDGACPFCCPASERLFYQGRLVIGLWDAFPVSPGHALLVPRRHVASWWDASPDEQAELLAALAAAREAIFQRHRPDGFNIGVNVGQAAGQTVFHLHVHLIPRYAGDVAEPRGGVRHVVPSKGYYPAAGSEAKAEGNRDGSVRDAAAVTQDPRLASATRLDGPGLQPLLTAPHSGSLIRGEDDPLLPHLVAHLAVARRVDVAVAFTLMSGVQALEEHLRDVLGRGGRVRFLTGDYLDGTQPAALRRLLDIEPAIDLRVFETAGPLGDALTTSSFHPKAYIITEADGSGVAFVGSSNVTRQALSKGLEWNYRVVSSVEAAGFRDVTCAFERLFQHPATVPVTSRWINAYEARRRPEAAGTWVIPDGVQEVPPEYVVVPEPNAVQEKALERLAETRADGNSAGLVVLATGLGKTWLSAFDSRRPEYRRVLFVAHREEILAQAMKTFRRIRPGSTFGHYTGTEKAPDADVLFASIQTLGRNHHLERFARDVFDYIVVDEFHHASARSYRRLIDHFQPKFLLGLTATPERTDGADLLALCQANLVYRCDLLEGIRLNLLCPFHYFGVPDEVDYTNIPWRNSRFEEEALTDAVATRTRAENALEQYRKRAGARTLAFCVSQRHADFMATYFHHAGVRAVAVHSGESSAPRAASLEQLEAGKLDVVFAVDMFNEGVDLPALDTVMMLRPTESRVVWLQQFGRGLRYLPDKSLTVVDYIGNHRTFLLKPQTLFNLEPGRQQVLNLLERLRRGTEELPPGCEVTYELEAVNILRALAQPPGTVSAVGVLRQRYEDFREVHGIRPTATEMFHEGYNPRATRPQYGSWLRFVEAMGDLDDAQEAALAEFGAFLDVLEVTPMTKSYKMVLLLAMLNTDAFPGAMAIAELLPEFRRLMVRNPHLAADCGEALQSDAELRRALETDPIDAWTGARGTGGTAYFAYTSGQFRTTFEAPSAVREALQELTREIVDWRLAAYIERFKQGPAAGEGVFSCKVSHSGGRPLIFLPPRGKSGAGGEGGRSAIPLGWVPILANGEHLDADFVKVAVNVVRRPGEEENILPEILRGWFGADAGRPGTNHRVIFEPQADGWHLRPAGKQPGRARAWDSYGRREIPALFGLEFSTAIWNAGFVTAPGQMFLLVTLPKQGKDERFQYTDRFLAPDRFRWQSQNRTAQASTHGQDIRHHAERGIAVHLFVRLASKRADGESAPFVYCGDVEFESWRGERPITVTWKLREAVPANLRPTLMA